MWSVVSKKSSKEEFKRRVQKKSSKEEFKRRFQKKSDNIEIIKQRKAQYI